MSDVDVVVIGLGPGGEATASGLAQAGLSVVAADERLVGGECPYFGCVPTKMMVRAADLLAEARRVGGTAGESTVVPSWRPVAERVRDEATDDWDDTVAVERLEEAGVRFVRGHGRLVAPRTVEVAGERITAARGVVLNTGTEPAVPPIPGLAETRFWTNRDAVKVTDLPATLAVIGGGAIGAELVQVFARFGVRVTLLDVADRILAQDEPEASEVVTEVFTSEGVRVMTGVEIGSVSEGEDGGFTLALGDGSEVHTDRLLVAAGRKNNLADIGLDSVGLDPDTAVLETDGRMRVTGAGDGLWAIGDITGHGPYTHMSMYQSAVAVDSVLGRDGKAAEYHAVPRVTFTDPEVAAVGLTEQQARDAGHEVRVGLARVPSSARGWLHRTGNEGVVKLVTEGDTLLGATAVGPAGGEVLSMLTTAVHARVPVSTLRSMIYAYPTFHRAVEDALRDLG